jgi:hypothetical protein
MRKALVAVTACFIFASLCLPGSVRAQNGTETEIVFTEQMNDDADKRAIDAAKQQLRRILSTYDLDPWIITQDVRIKPGVDPHSHPVLTVNTTHLDDDETQLSIFLHEQAHWFVSRSVSPFAPDAGEEKQAVIKDLEALYPDPPSAADYGTFVHLIVGWLELDGMAELVGEERAREIKRGLVQQYTEEPLSNTDKSYIWYNERVLEDTREIGAILSRHGLLITPEKGLATEANGG